MWGKEVRKCNTCGLILKNEKEMKRHAEIVGHFSYSIIKLNSEEFIKKLQVMEDRISRLEKLVQELAKKKRKDEKEVEETEEN